MTIMSVLINVITNSSCKNVNIVCFHNVDLSCNISHNLNTNIILKIYSNTKHSRYFLIATYGEYLRQVSEVKDTDSSVQNNL